MKVLITTSTFSETSNEPIRLLNSAGFEIVFNPYRRKLTQQELIPLLSQVHGVIAGLEMYDYNILSKSELKVISRCGSGLSNVDLDAAEKFDISVYSTPEGPTQSVAELTVGCLLSLIRNVPKVNNLMHRGKWEKSTGHLLQGMEVLLIGYGRIGKIVANILYTIGSRIIIYDPFISRDDVLPQFEKVELSDGIKSADVITLHSSGENLILGKPQFGMMKQGVYILNASRGRLIDEDALEQALVSGKVAGSWLDTFGEEPYTGNLSKYNQVILTPHIGSYTVEGREKMELESVKNLILGFEK